MFIRNTKITDSKQSCSLTYYFLNNILEKLLNTDKKLTLLIFKTLKKSQGGTHEHKSY
jgi:hypothetical protein